MNSSRRVLFCRSNPIAPDPRVEKEAAALAEAGYTVSLLGWDRSAKNPVADTVAGLPCRRLPIKAEYASGMRNLPALLRWQIGLTAWLWRHRENFDIIHACDFDTVLPAVLCKGLCGKRVVYDIFDFYADHLRSTPSLFKKAIRSLDLRLIGWVDALILVDDSRWQQIRGAHPRRSAVVYNAPPDLRPPPAQRNEDASLRLAYIGLLQVERGLFEMLNVLRRHPDWYLDLAGFGGDEAVLSASAGELPNVRWHGRVPYPRALELSAAADILFATYDPAIPNHRYSSPNKLFEAMMLGKPIIVADGTNIDRIVRQENCGLVVPYGDETALETALQELAANPALRRELGTNARRAYEERYGWPQMKRRLWELYAALP